jgi:hypothetical protein
MPVHLVIASSAVGAYTITADRVVASVAAALAVIAAVIGTVALRRSGADALRRSGADALRRSGADALRRSVAPDLRGRWQSIGALVAGIASAATGGLILVTADGGPGTGNGVVGGYGAVVVGLVAALLGGLALARSRRPA